VTAPLALGSRRLVIVTGKGGVGKSTIAGALARAASESGRRVLAVDVEGAGLSSIFGVPPPTVPTSIAPGLALVSVSARTALRDVVHGMMPLASLARRLLESTTFQLLAAAAPGLPEYLVLAKVIDWLDAKRLGRQRWDLLVVDAPASGHVVPLLTAPRTLSALVRLGPAASTLARMDATLRDSARTGVWIATLPEELPVREAVELHRALAGEAALPTEAPIVNAMPRRRFGRDHERLLASPDVDGAHPMVRAARFEIARRRAALTHAAALRRAVGGPVVRLPLHVPGPEPGDVVTAVTRAVARVTGLGA